MGIRTCFANDGPAAATNSAAAVIRTLFMVALLRAAIARLGGVGDGRFAEKAFALPAPKGEAVRTHTPPRSGLSNRAIRFALPGAFKSAERQGAGHFIALAGKRTFRGTAALAGDRRGSVVPGGGRGWRAARPTLRARRGRRAARLRTRARRVERAALARCPARAHAGGRISDAACRLTDLGRRHGAPAGP